MSFSTVIHADTIMMIQSFWTVSGQAVSISWISVADVWSAMKITPPPFIVNRRKNMTPPENLPPIADIADILLNQKVWAIAMKKSAKNM